MSFHKNIPPSILTEKFIVFKFLHIEVNNALYESQGNCVIKISGVGDFVIVRLCKGDQIIITDNLRTNNYKSIS